MRTKFGLGEEVYIIVVTNPLGSFGANVSLALVKVAKIFQVINRPTVYTMVDSQDFNYERHEDYVFGTTKEAKDAIKILA